MAREKYGYAESTTLRATVAGPIRSVVNEDKALENGMHMKIGDLSEAVVSNEVYDVQLPEQGDPIVLILSALTAYDTSTTLGQHEMYLRKEAGFPARSYYLYPADRYNVADYCITPLSNTVVKGNYVVVDTATGFLKEVASGTDMAAYGYVGQIEEIVMQSNLTKVAIRVIKNEKVSA